MIVKVGSKVQVASNEAIYELENVTVTKVGEEIQVMLSWHLNWCQRLHNAAVLVPQFASEFYDALEKGVLKEYIG